MTLEVPFTPEPVQPPAVPPASPRWKPWVILGAAGLVVLAIAVKATLKAKPAEGAGQRPVPVAVAKAQKGDLPIHLTGLGTVTPTDTVTVRSRVDGHLLRVHFKEGQMVRQGELLLEIDPRPFHVQLMQAEGQLAKDEAAFRNAKADLDRFQVLARQGILSSQQLDTQTSSVNQYQAALQADRAQVESARLNLTYSRVTAPVSGRVGLRMVDAGNMVRAADASGLAVITPIQPIDVVFTIPGDAVQQVLKRRAGGAPMAVEAFDRDLKNRLAQGRLEAVDNQVDTATGTVKLKARFTNEDQALFPNQFVNAQLQVDLLQGVVLVPTAAVQKGPEGAYVYVVKADATVEMRKVDVLAVEGDRTALRGGVAEGETVVTDGLERLRPGSRVILPQAAGSKKG